MLDDGKKMCYDRHDSENGDAVIFASNQRKSIEVASPIIFFLPFSTHLRSYTPTRNTLQNDTTAIQKLPRSLAYHSAHTNQQSL